MSLFRTKKRNTARKQSREKKRDLSRIHTSLKLNPKRMDQSVNITKHHL